jgi:hypothetical protein
VSQRFGFKALRRKEMQLLLAHRDYLSYCLRQNVPDKREMNLFRLLQEHEHLDPKIRVSLQGAFALKYLYETTDKL